MKKVTIKMLAFSALTCFALACGGSQPTSTESESTEVKATETVGEEVKKEELAGKGVYATYCSVCHQSDGKGVPNMNPPLANKEWVGGEKNRLIKIVLNGLSGKISVDGTPYDNVMASHDFLNDKQIADVLTYVRKSFGNDYEAITEEEVKTVRAENKK